MSLLSGILMVLRSVQHVWHSFLHCCLSFSLHKLFKWTGVLFSSDTHQGSFNYFCCNFGLNSDLVECSTQPFQNIYKKIWNWPYVRRVKNHHCSLYILSSVFTVYLKNVQYVNVIILYGVYRKAESTKGARDYAGSVFFIVRTRYNKNRKGYVYGRGAYSGAWQK